MRPSWVHVRLSPRIVELPVPLPWLLRKIPDIVSNLPTPLSTLRKLVRHAGADRAVQGVLIELSPLMAGWAVCASLRRVLSNLREAGVSVAVYLPAGGGNKELYVASAADRILVGPEASFHLWGLAIETRHYKSLLDKLGIEADVVAQGPYKAAMEPFTRDSMSEPHREQLEALLSAIDDALVTALAQRPGFDGSKVRDLFSSGLFLGSELKQAGLADAVSYDDDVPNVLTTGSARAPARMEPAGRYLGRRARRFFLPLSRPRCIGVVSIHGAIMPRPSATGPTHPAIAALRAARRDPSVLGVVLHVSSPGGSASLSDLIHREVIRLREKKPVVAYFSDVAASGGYYVAAAAHAIVAQPVTITGSIGVISTKIVLGKLLDRIGVRTETLRRGPHADMFSASRNLTDEERTILERQTRGFYDRFIAVVAEGRHKTKEEIEPLAGGRVWAGTDAKAHGLVDHLGDFETAVQEVRGRLGLPDAAAARIEARAITVRGGPLPPAEPTQPPAAFSELGRIALSGEPVLYYAVVPEVV